MDLKSVIGLLQKRVKTLYLGMHMVTRERPVTEEDPLGPDDVDPSWECSICLENFSDKENITVLKCAHAFHTTCIERWKQGKRSPLCPFCRTPINGMQAGSESEDDEFDLSDGAPIVARGRGDEEDEIDLSDRRTRLPGDRTAPSQPNGHDEIGFFRNYYYRSDDRVEQDAEDEIDLSHSIFRNNYYRSSVPPSDEDSIIRQIRWVEL